MAFNSTHPFDEIAPSSPSTSAPSSTPLQKMPCSVYINCRGPDVKHTVSRAICEVLRGRGLRVFPSSEELPFGDILPASIQQAMCSASLYIAIFSPHYAESVWCLSELSFMLKTGSPVIPVFYCVDPSDLRWVSHGKGIYADAFLRHEQKGRHSPEKLQEWKTALHNVSLYWGEIITDYYEEKLETIANHILEVMQIVPLEVAEHRVDLQEAVSDFEKIVGPTTLQKPLVKNLPYDVFITHRGVDGKFTLAKSIYNVLGGMGLRVFLDYEELQFGDFLPGVILQAMLSASLNVSIFSPNFAQSPWCLDEVSFMRKTGTPTIPVFYHVQPDDLQYVTRGRYAGAFYEHQVKGGYSLEQLQEWKIALQEVPFHSGYIINNDDDVQRFLSEEQRVLKNIVNVVLNKKRKTPLVVAKHPVGLEEAASEFDEMIAPESAKSHSNVRILGIWGVGGSGKTTLAREIYNRKYQTMRRSTFLSDVRDAGVTGLLVEKQKKLLEDLGVKGAIFENVEQGKRILQSLLRSVSMLIVLDDVDHKDQLDALLPAPHCLGVRSLIIVTTRNSDFLKAWGISTTYQMRALNSTHAKQLLCWHAFLQPYPLSGFEDLVEKFIIVCRGLLLQLQVFGGQLYGCSKDYWQDQLNQISLRDPDEDIESRLRVSYDALHEEEKLMFLDIACFLIGEKKNLAIAIWDGCRLHGLQRLETLMSKSLVELDQQSSIRMQGPLRELGREIAKEQPPYRLWSSTQIDLIKKHAEGSLQIRGIMAAITQFSPCSAHLEFPSYSSPYQPPFEECLKITQNSISRSCPHRPLSLGLKLLVVTGDDFRTKFIKLSEELVWLRWFDFKHAKLPSWKSLKNLRILELYGATLKELWEDGTHPPFKQLTELNITCGWGSSLQRFPSSISDLKHLKKIALIGYLGDEFAFQRLPDEFCDLEKLEHLELRQCRVLSSLPSHFGQLTMLRHLDLSSCVELRMLPVSFKQLTHLEYLDLSGCRKLTFRSVFLENISKLEKLDLSGCRRLQELPPGIASQAYLRQLNMRDTRLRNMVSNMDQLRKLLSLQIGSPFLRCLPPSLGDLSSLTHLTIFDCPNLESLPESVGLLYRLEYLCIESSGLKCLPESFSQLACLQAFEISGCPIRELDFGKESSSPSCLYSLKLLHIADTQLSRVSISNDCCPVLKILQLVQNEVLMEILTLPRSLEEIELWECERLEDISCIHDLPNLKYRQINGCQEFDDSI